MLRHFLTIGAVNTVTGAQPHSPGQRGPLNLPIGPLPAMQMPGEVAKTIPVMANFNWILQVLQTATFATIEDDSAVLLGSRKLVAGTNVTFVDSYPDTGPGNHATLTINATGGGGGGKEIFFDVDPPPAGTELDWLAWWNTEEGALKIWYTIADGDPDSDQWVDAMPARTGPSGSSPLTTKGDIWGYDTGDARIPVGADGTVLTADSGDPLGVSWQATGGSPLTTKGDLLGFDTAVDRVPIGTNGQVLTANSGQALGLEWATPSYAPVGAEYLVLLANATLTNERVLTAGTNITLTDFGPGSTLVIDAAGTASPLTTKGDIYGFDTADARVPVGSNGKVLTADSTAGVGVSWQTPAVYAPVGAQYLTLATDGTLTNERVLTAGTNISFTDNGAGSTLIIDATGAASPLTTKGDLFGFSTVDARVAIGTNGFVLTADSAQALGLKWAAPATAGTVTSVALTMPAGFSVGGSPITSSGTLAITGGPNASFVTMALNGDLANERVLTQGTGITITDGGAGGNVTIASTITQAGASLSQEFTGSGSFSVPASVSLVWVDMIGGGGAGGGSNAAATGGGGGGSGEAVTGMPVTVVGGGTVTVTIGTGGTGVSGANGNAGTATSFGAASVAGGLGGLNSGTAGNGGGAKGGIGATKTSPGTVGAIGTQESTVHFGGSAGGSGGSTTGSAGGAGGPSGPFAGAAGGAVASVQAGGGSGGCSVYGIGGAAGAGGANGSAPAAGCYGAGGGGGGGKAANSTGGDGLAGYVRVYWFG